MDSPRAEKDTENFVLLQGFAVRDGSDKEGRHLDANLLNLLRWFISIILNWGQYHP